MAVNGGMETEAQRKRRSLLEQEMERQKRNRDSQQVAADMEMQNASDEAIENLMGLSGQIQPQQPQWDSSQYPPNDPMGLGLPQPQAHGMGPVYQPFLGDADVDQYIRQHPNDYRQYNAQADLLQQGKPQNEQELAIYRDAALQGEDNLTRYNQQMDLFQNSMDEAGRKARDVPQVDERAANAKLHELQLSTERLMRFAAQNQNNRQGAMAFQQAQQLAKQAEAMQQGLDKRQSDWQQARESQRLLGDALQSFVDAQSASADQRNPQLLGSMAVMEARAKAQGKGKSNGAPGDELTALEKYAASINDRMKAMPEEERSGNPAYAGWQDQLRQAQDRIMAIRREATPLAKPKPTLGQQAQNNPQAVASLLPAYEEELRRRGLL